MEGFHTSQFYNWMFTAWNEPNPMKDEISFMVYQKEKCPTTGKEHYQGYVEFKKKVTLRKIKTIFRDDTIHFDVRRGSQENAINYCSKEKSRIGETHYYGEQKNQGHRTDLDSMFDMIENGIPVYYILQAYRGNALRHVNMLCRAFDIMNGYDKHHTTIKNTYDEFERIIANPVAATSSQK